MGSHRVRHDWSDLAAAAALALSCAHTATCWTSHASLLPLRVHLETHTAYPADWLLTLDRLFLVFYSVIGKRNSDFLTQNSLQPDTKERQIGIHACSVDGGEPRVQGNILWGAQGRGRRWWVGHAGLRGYLGETTAPENPFVYSRISRFFGHSANKKSLLNIVWCILPCIFSFPLSTACGAKGRVGFQLRNIVLLFSKTTSSSLSL